MGYGFAVRIPESDYECKAMRASGPGGQHVNKVATAIHLRFDIGASSLTEDQKARLRRYPDQRITEEGILLIKAESHRSQLKNKEEAVRKLHALLEKALRPKKVRKASKPTYAAQQARRLEKAHRSKIKQNRGKVDRGQQE